MVTDFKKKDTEINNLLKNKKSLKINNQIIEQVSSHKYLGVTVDEKLQQNDQINNITNNSILSQIGSV